MMPPNTQQQQALDVQNCFVDHFWSKDKTGMDQLLKYINTTHDELDMLHTIYTQRAQLEKEFGEKLLALSTIRGKTTADEGVSAAYHAIAMELENTANSHVDLSEKLSSQFAAELESKVEDYKLLLEKWTHTLNDLYFERQDKTSDLLKIRAKYLKEHELSKGQSTSTMEKLKGQYKSLVAEVDEVSQEWNSTWKDACEVLEAMEEDRIELLKSNVWGYANLASERLLIEDEWCETIRKTLETCNVENVIEKCISLHGTGSKVPTTNDYVGEQMKEYKKKKALANTPTPPVKPARKQEERPAIRSFQSKLMEEETEEEPPKPKPRRKQQELPREIEEPKAPQPKPRRQAQPIPVQREEEDNEEEHVPMPKPRRNTSQQEERVKETKPVVQQSKPSQQQSDEEEESYSPRMPPSDVPQPTKKEYDHQAAPVQQVQPVDRTFSKRDEDRMKLIRNSVSDNVGSTASRGQIKRKPLNKSLMDQVSNQMAMARQQRQEETTKAPSPLSTTNNKPKRTGSNGSLDSLLKSFEGGNPVSRKESPPPNAPVSEEARSRRQPSEYKPDTGSIASRRGPIQTNTSTSQEVPRKDNSSANKQDQYTHPVAPVNNGPPKSPRPPAQQIGPESGQQMDPYNTYSNQQPQFKQNNAMMNQQVPDNMYAHHTQQYNNTPQHYMGQHQQQHMVQPQRSPMMQPQRSPMMQPQRSPMMQPQRSPMMQPQRSPMMAHSPMMQPAQQPYNPHNNCLPPPISIPTNFGATPQPSPSNSYCNMSGAVSPGGVLPPPAVPYHQPPPPSRPTQYNDGRPILFWSRAKYDYMATDQGELSLNANTLVGVLEADMTQPSWWMGAIWDEYNQAWSIEGSIPSNFMTNA